MTAGIPGRRARRRPRPVKTYDDSPREGHREFSGDGTGAVLRTDFDVTDYFHTTPQPVEVDGEAIGKAVQQAGANVADLELLRWDLEYLRNIDAAVYSETRTMYSSWTVNEARITAFVATWMWERLGWAHSVRKVCEELPGADGPPLEADHQSVFDRLRMVYSDRFLPTVGTLWSIVAGERVTAGHMARMAIQEGALLAAYRALLPRLEPMAEAHRVIREIIARRELSVDFFTQEALARIRRSPGERVAAAIVFRASGSPLRPGGIRPPQERESLLRIFSHSADREALWAAREIIAAELPEVATRGGSYVRSRDRRN